MTNRTNILRAAVAAVLLSLTGALVALLLAPHATPVPVPVRTVTAPAPVQSALPVAVSDTARDDAAAEGRDIVVVRYERAPKDLWAALRKAGYRGDPTDGCECLYVPVDTVVKVPGGLYVATLDGWSACVDWTTTGTKCSGPADAAPVLLSGADLVADPVAATNAQVAVLTPAQRARYGSGHNTLCSSVPQCAAYDREVMHREPSYGTG